MWLRWGAGIGSGLLLGLSDGGCGNVKWMASCEMLLLVRGAVAL
jgi:hypothetical protein